VCIRVSAPSRHCTQCCLRRKGGEEELSINQPTVLVCLTTLDLFYVVTSTPTALHWTAECLQMTVCVSTRYHGYLTYSTLNTVSRTVLCVVYFYWSVTALAHHLLTNSLYLSHLRTDSTQSLRCDAV
jgi:hypothetical protein